MSFFKLLTHLTATLIAILLFCGQIQLAFAEFDCTTVSEIPIAECEVLVSFYNSAGGDSWINNNGWLISNTPCSWSGITCNDGHVSRIVLSSNQLTGSIPSELGNLTSLTELYLRSNQLTSSIPSELGNMANLQELNLSINQLTGSIPTELGNLANLQELYLKSNQLTGNIPTELGNLTNLQDLSLYSNQLTGCRYQKLYPLPLSRGQPIGAVRKMVKMNRLRNYPPPKNRCIGIANGCWAHHGDWCHRRRRIFEYLLYDRWSAADKADRGDHYLVL